MEGARRLFTTVTPPASTPAAEELVKRDQHSSECCLKIGWLPLRIVLASRRMLANIAKIIRVPPFFIVQAIEILCNSDYLCNAYATVGGRDPSRPSTLPYPPGCVEKLFGESEPILNRGSEDRQDEAEKTRSVASCAAFRGL